MPNFSFENMSLPQSLGEPITRLSLEYAAIPKLGPTTPTRYMNVNDAALYPNPLDETPREDYLGVDRLGNHFTYQPYQAQLDVSPPQSVTCSFTGNLPHLTQSPVGTNPFSFDSTRSNGYRNFSLTAFPDSASQHSPERLKITKPRVTTLYWELQKTTCYQVKAQGVVVSRRASDNYVNGTKLLNVTGMSRGKRDGTLKTEKGRIVVRNGPMNLKGVWIPFNRAAEIARNEGVDGLLYPLFSRDIRLLFNEKEREVNQNSGCESESQHEQ